MLRVLSRVGSRCLAAHVIVVAAVPTSCGPEAEPTFDDLCAERCRTAIECGGLPTQDPPNIDAVCAVQCNPDSFTCHEGWKDIWLCVDEELVDACPADVRDVLPIPKGSPCEAIYFDLLKCD